MTDAAPWPSVALCDLTHEITSGATPQSGSPRYYTERDDGIPFAKIDDLSASDGQYIASTMLHVTDAALRETALKTYPAGTILLSMYGTIGLTKIAARSLSANQALAALVPPFRCDPKFLYHVLVWSRAQWERFKAQTTQANLSGAIVRAFHIPNPPLDQQRRIAEILDTIDEQIRKTEQIIAMLKLGKHGLLIDLLTRGLDDQGELRDPVRHPGQFRETPFGRVPTSWKVIPLGTLCRRITYGFTNPMPTAASGPWMLTAADIGYGSVNLTAARHTTESAFERDLSDKSQPQRGDILITKDGTLGRVACLDLARVCVNQSVAVARPKVGVSTRFLTQYLLSPSGQEAMLRDAGGSTIKHLYISKLGSLQIPIPPKPEADQIVSVIDQAQARFDREVHLLDKLRLLKDGLMDDLLTGRVRVPIGLRA